MSLQRLPLQTPLISVIIATYNYGHLIERAIESVLAQTFHDFELIVIDDGSTDDTQHRLEQYAGRLRSIRKDNGGQSSAYNLGARLSQGQFVLILDADDEMLPDCLANLAQVVDANADSPDTCIYFGGYISVSETGKGSIKPAADIPREAEARLEKFLKRKVTGLQHGSTLTPRAVFERIQYPDSLRSNTDIVFFGQVLANYPAVRIDKILSRIHAHPQRTRRQLDKILDSGLAPVDALFDPAIVPARLMHLKRLYTARRLRSIARLLYLDKRFTEARNYYLSAFRHQPASLMELTSLRKAFMSIVYSLIQ